MEQHTVQQQSTQEQSNSISQTTIPAQATTVVPMRSIGATIFADRERFMHVVFPVIAGVPTAIVILFFFDLGPKYKDILDHIFSPIITGVTSGFILYILGLKR